MPYTGSGFKQAPKEPINKEVYQERESEVDENVAKVFAEQNDNHDKKDIELVDQSDCAGGACPIR